MSLPRGWGVATVEELAGPSGIVSDGDWVESKDQDSTGKVRLTQLADVGDGSFRDRSARFMTKEAAERLRCTYLEPKDVLIARMPDPIGRACIFPEIGQPAVTAVDVMIWRTDGKIAEAEWFVRWINSPAVRRLMAEGAGGTTRQRIAGGRVKEITLPVPPTAEQRRIVAKLDALTARITRARAELDRVPVLANRLRATALKDAVDGNQTAMSSSRNSWDVEKRMLISARRQKYLAARRGSRVSQDIPSNVTNLTGNRSSWLDCYLADVVDLRVGHAFKSADFSDSGIRLIRGANIAPGRVDWIDTVFLPESLSGSYAKYVLEAGDIVIAMDRPLISSGLKIAQLTNADAGALLVQRVANPRGTEFITTGYLYLILQSYLFLQQIENHATGSDLPHISANDLLTTRCPLPPIAVQNEITKVVDGVFARADHLEAEAARARKLLDRLESAILAKAFRGELVPQDDNDEPAEKLLERIRAERAAAPKDKRGRKSRA